MAMKLRQRWISVCLLGATVWFCTILLSLRYGMTNHERLDVQGRFLLRNLESLSSRSVARASNGPPSSSIPERRSLDPSATSRHSDPKSSAKSGAGLSNDSTIFIVPRDWPKYEYRPVKDRRKFEALFRDFPSSNRVPENIGDDDKLYLHKRSSHDGPSARFHRGINRYELYPFNDTDIVEPLLTYLGHASLGRARSKRGGTQVKLSLVFQDGGTAIMKPWRVPREYETLPDHYYFADIERHTAEIAAFHLDRILDFRRVVPVSGRVFNLSSEVRRVASISLNKTFFYSPANNLCFMTDCDQYCGKSRTPVCGNPDKIEGAVIAFLPTEPDGERTAWVHPFKRSYSKQRKAEWEGDPQYCKREVMTREPYMSGRHLLDIIDLAIFDFFMGNMDRHSYHTFTSFGNFTSLIYYDHGRGFGRYHTDEMSCLAPLIQCCIVRKSTYERLLILQKEEYKLGDVMRESLSTDIIAPVLYEPHYAALDRRLRIVLEQIQKCVATAKTPEEVLKPEPRIEDFVEEE